MDCLEESSFVPAQEEVARFPVPEALPQLHPEAVVACPGQEALLPGLEVVESEQERLALLVQWEELQSALLDLVGQEEPEAILAPYFPLKQAPT